MAFVADPIGSIPIFPLHPLMQHCVKSAVFIFSACAKSEKNVSCSGHITSAILHS
jgi:hypothetical protein